MASPIDSLFQWESWELNDLTEYFDDCTLKIDISNLHPKLVKGATFDAIELDHCDGKLYFINVFKSGEREAIEIKFGLCLHNEDKTKQHLIFKEE